MNPIPCQNLIPLFHTLRTSSNWAVVELVRRVQGAYNPVLRDSLFFLEVISIDRYVPLPAVPLSLSSPYLAAISLPFGQLVLVLHSPFRFPGHLTFHN